MLRLAVLAALLGAWYPAGLGLFVLAARALVLAVPIAGAAAWRCAAFGIAIVAAVGAAWCCCSRGRSRTRTPASTRPRFGFAFRPDLDLSQILRFDTGPSGAGWAMWGLVVAAAVPLFVATGDRAGLDRARAGCSRSSAGPSVWVPARFFPDTSVLAPEAGLTARRARARALRSASRCRCSSTASTRSGSAGANRR